MNRMASWHRLLLALFISFGALAFAACQGPDGATGSQGSKGDAGAQGPAGDQGPTGAKGSAGSQGSKGDVGAKGPAGAQGPVGEPAPEVVTVAAEPESCAVCHKGAGAEHQAIYDNYADESTLDLTIDSVVSVANVADPALFRAFESM